MPSLIEQLQAEALDPEVRVSDLVRKAKLVASKLGLDEFEKWADAELRGYTDLAAVPEYRDVHGTPVWFDHYRGWRAMNFSGDGVRWAKKFSENKAIQPIGELDSLMGQSSGSGGEAGSFHIPFGAELTAAICPERFGGVALRGTARGVHTGTGPGSRPRARRRCGDGVPRGRAGSGGQGSRKGVAGAEAHPRARGEGDEQGARDRD
jgi:AbiTii-like protein